MTQAQSDESALAERLPAPLRLRSAGVGVVAAGAVLAALSLVVAFGPAAGVLVAVAVLGAVRFRTDQVAVQLSLGFGAVGTIGLLEVYTTAGLGLAAQELAGLAVVLGVVDIFLGTVIFTVRPESSD